jgi:tRNA (mo5U34)-methyltransferase
MNKLFLDFFSDLSDHGLKQYADFFSQTLSAQLQTSEKNRRAWFSAIENLPEISSTDYSLQESAISVHSKESLSKRQLEMLRQSLMDLSPWRKGPFQFFDIYVDTEWRSDYKWDRISQKISPLSGKKVLDIGCGNGYHMWRMFGDGASLVIGADPSFQFLSQFQAIKKYIGKAPVHLLPIGFEQLPASMPEFDSVFAMGVLYHRRSPMDFLKSIKSQLKPGGELILETLVITGSELEVLVPPNRYAQMNNVWFIPTPQGLIKWLEKCGYKNPQLINLCKTTTEEQRATEWMTSHSLANFLDPADSNKTIEGHPAPLRATVIANK